MNIQALDGVWELIERPLSDGVEAAPAVAVAATQLHAAVPGDVNAVLAAAESLPDPLSALNFRQYSDWVPQRSWWYRRTFSVPAASATAAAAILSLDGLDMHADIWLNGQYLGHHTSTFLPFLLDIRSRLLLDCENQLLVRLTTGSERVAGQYPDYPWLKAVPTEAGRGYPERGFPERIFLRKPAYTWGWDWSPHLPTCGITAPCSIRYEDESEVRGIRLRVQALGTEGATVDLRVETVRHTLTGTAWGELRVCLRDETGKEHCVQSGCVLIRSGIGHTALTLQIPHPRLWWPNGSGHPHRYTVEAQLTIDDRTTILAPFQWGLRTVALDVRPGVFRFLINGTPVFIKGGNWIPCDHLYGRTTPARLECLVAEAAEAHFNCLRIWGGGRYELDAFYEACDRHGIFLWHDFMSACAPLPGDDKDFADLFRAEAEYQLARLHNRACMLLWCGNNEVGGCYEWLRAQYPAGRDPGWPLYFELLPRLVSDLAPHIPYWPTSPYGGATTVNDLTVGDDNHWVVMRPEKEYWSNPEYWDHPSISIFNSEYGYGGPCCLESTREYLGSDTPNLFNEVGHQHTNSFYNIPRVNFSISEHYGDPAGLPLADYILLGGLCQGLNLGYSLESQRANQQTWGSIFWMYNDAWGENGWTIIDYYLRRKISYYNVRRCLAPQRLVLRRGGQAFGGSDGEVVVMLLNDGTTPLSASVQVGYLSYDGSCRQLTTVQSQVPGQGQTILATLPVPDPEALRRGTLVAIPAESGTLEPASWRHCRHREAGLPPARVQVVESHTDGQDLHLTVTTDAFAHAVHFTLAGHWRLDDCYFDLLPGETRSVRIFGGARLPETPEIRHQNG